MCHFRDVYSTCNKGALNMHVILYFDDDGFLHYHIYSLVNCVGKKCRILNPSIELYMNEYRPRYQYVE